MSSHSISERVQGTAKRSNAALWIVQIGVAGMFLLAGGAQVSGNPMMVAMFAKLGIGQWFRYLTGTPEILGALGLLTPFASGLAAAELLVVMFGAVASHLLILGGSPMPALVLLFASGLIGWGRRSQLVALLRQAAKSSP